ncbi:hypothetical protein ACFP81_12670 [Deinococcus lacus]|uniref:Uncharacterized protein n=1 Tax=Deinococcus lacus TaxID=392561 RepID=A0ABW1YEM7_9DEIO
MTRPLAARLAQAQLIGFDLVATSPRGGGEVHVRLSGHITGTEGEPLYLFAPVPRPLGQLLSRDARDLLGPVTAVHAVAYRTFGVGEDLRTAEVQSRYLARKKQLDRVRQVQVFDHRLLRRGEGVFHEVILRSAFFADEAGRSVHPALLAGGSFGGVMAHALSGFNDRFYGTSEQAALPVPTARGRELTAQFLPAPPAPPVVKPAKVKPARTGLPAQQPEAGPAQPVHPDPEPEPQAPTRASSVPETLPEAGAVPPAPYEGERGDGGGRRLWL